MNPLIAEGMDALTPRLRTHWQERDQPVQS